MSSSPPLPIALTPKPRSVIFRQLRESLILGGLALCGLVTIGITLCIIWILARETIEFFSQAHPNVQGEMVSVGPLEFFTSIQWNPDLGGDHHFGVWPLIVGTFKIVFVSMAFAIPLGLITAIWLAEYASHKMRSVIKPVLETLAGVPTVVFGFFALAAITPALQWAADHAVNPWLAPFSQFCGAGDPWELEIGTYNALSAGLAVGILCLPLITSLTEDALRSVPKMLREGSYGLGSSRFETSIKVVFPAALSGTIASILLAISRAVGETMIVALAAGSRPVQMTKQVLDQQGDPILDEAGHAMTEVDWTSCFSLTTDLQPITGYMVQVFKGDGTVGSVEYYSSYAVAMTLFVITLILTLLGNWIRKRFQQSYS